jgi:hypothetical protein
MSNQRTDSPASPTFIRSLVAVSAAALFAGACAADSVGFDDDGQGGTGNATTTDTGGSGGMGGGTGGSPGACGTDCSTIDTPQCQVAQCNVQSGQCEVVPDEEGTGCDDGVFCTASDSCSAGSCIGGLPNDCGMTPAQCNEVTCDENSNSCSEQASMNGSACQDPNDQCRMGMTCSNGLCIGGSVDDCFFFPVPSDCHIAACDPMDGMCKVETGNENGACVDPNDLCTDNKTCDNMGMCLGGGPKDCSNLDADCVEGVCDSMNGQCVTQALSQGSSCAGAADDCNIGLCDNNGVCQAAPSNESGVCEDGNPCTAGETCTSGSCGGGQMIQQVIYFQDDFANNNQGWTEWVSTNMGATLTQLDNEWQIGAATTSTGHTTSCGSGDPATDNTSTNDNGVAGIVIGGNAAVTLHEGYWLTSPPVNVANVNGPLWVGFQRWLNSDYTPYMQNSVEVWDGNAWVNVWQSGSFPGVQDAQWELQQYDISAYKNSALRVRFGFALGSTGAYTCSQWNVDDFVIANVVCP